jgi:hypothetical protein
MKPASPCLKLRRPYQAPTVTEIVLDAQEAMLTPCSWTALHISPLCSPPNSSIMPIR